VNRNSWLPLLTSLGVVLGPTAMKVAETRAHPGEATTEPPQGQEACVLTSKAQVFKTPSGAGASDLRDVLRLHTQVQIVSARRDWRRIAYQKGGVFSTGWIAAADVGDCEERGGGVDEHEAATDLDDLDVFNGCGLRCDAKSVAVGTLNELKNRWTAPTNADVDPVVDLAALLRRGDDSNRWSTSRGAEVVGYVHDVKKGGDETCNCHAKGEDDIDTHIELVLDPNESGKPNRVIVEVTPRWRAIMQARGVDWTTATLRETLLGRWVRVRGWLFYDREHENESENANPGHAGNWRGTAWEIHPITAITVTSKPH